MFDKELIELILKSKEDELTTLQGQQSVNQKDIENLTKEINYLKATLVRYEIAVLLKLDKDEKYNMRDFFGIEEENINNFNLTPEEINQYNNLISKLPPEQLQRFKIRKKMAEVLGDNIDEQYKTTDFYGIENIDPNAIKYNLSQEKIKEFNDLINQINSIAEDTTKTINIKEEAIKVLTSAYNKINIEDVNVYNQIKKPYLETIDKLINKIDEEKRNTIFSNVSNYDLAQDLQKQYPDIKIKMDIKAVEKLLKEFELSKIPEEKYDDYMSLLCNNINVLYEDDNNKAKIENMLNNLKKDNYLLRNELNSRLKNINNVNFELLDSELKKLVDYLNKNYDSLDERKRDAYYKLIESKISKDSNDLNKVNNINDILLSITNNTLSERLHNKLSSNDTLKFNNQHLSSYQLLIKEQINELQKKKAKYVSKNSSNSIMSAHNEIRIKEIEKEIEELKSIQADYENNSSIKRLDEKYNEKTDKIIELKQEIAELQHLKLQIKSKFHQKIISKKIEKRTKKIKKLKQSHVRIIGSQKRIMTPKLWLKRKSNMFNRHFESRVETYKEYSKNYAKMAETEKKLNGMFSGIKALFYEHKANKYEKKSEFNIKICDLLNNSKVKIQGATKKLFNQQKIDQAKQKYQQKQRTAV